MATSAVLEITLPTGNDRTEATLLRVLAIYEAIGVVRVLQDYDLNTPPGGPSEGDLYATGSSATGDWSGHDEEFALFYNGGWIFATLPDDFGPMLDVDSSATVDRVGGTWSAV